MSGFVGVVGPACRAEELEWLSQATAYMAFRGPDSRRTWNDESAGLGHALLATSPNETGHTYPAGLDGQVWITGDVRLDARAELVRRLEGRGRAASLASADLELVLHAYHAWGDECVAQLTGDFAFAIWDRRTRRLFCARDQFGVAQFYFAKAGDHLLFGNTLETLLLHPAISDELNEAAVGDFLVFGFNTAPPATMFASIQRLPPAHSLSWSGGRVQLARYWKAPEVGDFLRYSKPADYVDRFRELFTSAVADRLGSGAMSVQLSGGMDSTSIAVTAHRALQDAGKPFHLKALTYVLDGVADNQEGDYARQVSDSLGIDREVLSAGSYELRDPLLSDFVPPGPISFLPTMAQHDLSRRASAHGRVVLTGQGGDVLLRFRPSYWIEWMAAGRFGLLTGAVAQHLRLFHRLPNSFFRTAVSRLRLRADKVVFPDWLNPAFVQRSGLKERAREMAARLTRVDAQALAESPFWSDVFGWCDPGFTRLPVRYRHPFFDVRLLDYVVSLPPAPWFPHKQILRAAMRGHLPEAVRVRRKAPLSAGSGRMLARRADLPSGIEQVIARASSLERFVDQDLLARLARVESLPKGLIDQDVMNSLGLAHWLYHWRRPTLPTSGQHLTVRRATARLVVAAH